MFIRYNSEDPFYDLINAILGTERPAQSNKLLTHYLDGQPVIKTNVPTVTYTENGYLTVIAEMPGLDKKDISITVEDKTIIIKGSVKNQKLPEVIDHVAGALLPKEDYIAYVIPTVRYTVEDVEKEYKEGRITLKFPLDLEVDKPKTITFE